MVENEYRVIGPPGTGKTTYLCSQAKRAVESYSERSGGVPADCRAVLISSLTKAAANELRGRGLEMPKEQIGTLHAHAFHALGRPQLCVDGGPVEEWNTYCTDRKRYEWQLNVKRKAPDQDDVEDKADSDLLADYHRRRSELLDRQTWSNRLLEFATAYEEWKLENDYVDFSDVIHNAFLSIDSAPGMPSVIMVDEAQDHDRAELRLIRKWARNCERVVICGDPDQNLYQWRGADPKAFYEAEIPEQNTRILAQSYRVPRAVHSAAMRMIGRIKNRPTVEYHPRDFDGEVRQIDGSITDGRVDEVLELAAPYIAAGKKVMFLAACEYMLRGLIRELKDRGIPFWNPFARERGGFNPLTPAKGTSAADRLLNYLLPHEAYYGENARSWTWRELHSWVDVCLSDGLLRPGMKSAIAKRAKEEDTLATAEELEGCFQEAAYEKLIDDPVSFIQGALNRKKCGTVEYALRVLKRRGINELEKTPNVIVGTIHSVKGGEADVVFLSPDLSPQGFEQYEGRGCDAIYRQMYVGITRARETLFLCDGGGRGKYRRCVEW